MEENQNIQESVFLFYESQIDRVSIYIKLKEKIILIVAVEDYGGIVNLNTDSTCES